MSKRRLLKAVAHREGGPKGNWCTRAGRLGPSEGIGKPAIFIGSVTQTLRGFPQKGGMGGENRPTWTVSFRHTEYAWE